MSRVLIRSGIVVGVLLAALFIPGDAGSQTQGQCLTNAQCNDQCICMMGNCVFAYGRDYSINIMTATNIPQGKLDGSGAWDALGGLPDPFVVMTIDGRRYQTMPVANTLSARWNYDVSPVRLNQTTQVQWALWDYDNGTAHDYIVGTKPYHLSVQDIRRGTLVYTFNGVNVTLRIDPL